MNSFQIQDDLIFEVINSQTSFTKVESSSFFELLFLNPEKLPKTSSILINFDSVVEFTSNRVIFSKYSYFFVLEISNGILEMDDENYLIVRYNDYCNFIIQKYNEDIKQLAFTNDSNIVTEYSYMPQFSIACFDDINFTYPRQIRQGVPVISTVPSVIDSNSTSAEIQSYNNGLGPITKKIYFRIVCNKVMESISIGDTSEMTLKIYIPNGLDTVKPAVYRPMTLVSNDSTNGISIYSANYDFFQQGIYQGIEYVDGYMYADVQVGLTVQKSMPLEFDFLL
jgi:hypothetical protein